MLCVDGYLSQVVGYCRHSRSASGLPAVFISFSMRACGIRTTTRLGNSPFPKTEGAIFTGGLSVERNHVEFHRPGLFAANDYYRHFLRGTFGCLSVESAGARRGSGDSAAQCRVRRLCWRTRHAGSLGGALRLACHSCIGRDVMCVGLLCHEPAGC